MTKRLSEGCYYRMIAGADLAPAYAIAHPDMVAGIVLINGAVPLDALLVEGEARLRELLKSPVMKLSRWLIRFTPYNYQIGVMPMPISLLS